MATDGSVPHLCDFLLSQRCETTKAAAVVGISALLLIAGCRQDMQDQPKMIPQRGSNSSPTIAARVRRW